MIFPFGCRKESGLRLFEIANAIVKGPNLPANIVKIISSRPIFDSSGVNPIDKPTVPNAEVASNKYIRKSWPLSVMVRSMVIMTTMNNPLRATVNAFKYGFNYNSTFK